MNLPNCATMFTQRSEPLQDVLVIMSEVERKLFMPMKIANRFDRIRKLTKNNAKRKHGKKEAQSRGVFKTRQQPHTNMQTNLLKEYFYQRYHHTHSMEILSGKKRETNQKEKY